MRIGDMFAQQIDRDITGVIKVGQLEEKNKKEELREYVITRELSRHFTTFFSNYTDSINHPTDKIGVWISGFFGSGKSHFLKILSYVLDNTEVEGRHAMDYFAEKEQLAADSMTLSNMKLAGQTPTQAILFNVDSKSAATGKSDSNAIVLVFNRVFNEKLGYCGAIPALADLEREMDEDGKFEAFKQSFEAVYGKPWVESRHKYRTIRDKVKKSLVDCGYMSEEAASAWVQESTATYNIAIEDFAKRVQDYIDKTGDRVVFLVDEIGQFISRNTNLMLNLQTMTEKLGEFCKGKAWIIVTAQEDLDSMTEDMEDNKQQDKNDFSKIQDRFNTRLSLSSVNVDEVIRERILKKDSTAEETLKALYASHETDIHNVVDFKEATEMKKVNTEEEFAAVYPFLPYQFNLLGTVLNSIRLNSASGKNLSEGERSMLGAYQEAAKNIKEEEDGVLVPFYLFYDNLVKFLDHTHASVIQRAQENSVLNPTGDADCFTVNVLKTLFLLKYVDGVPLTIHNIRVLMRTHINDDLTTMKTRIDESLELLTREMLVQPVRDQYEFLTDEEQDINREIDRRNIQNTDVIEAVTNMVFDQIYKITRYKVGEHGGRYTFPFNQAVDNHPRKGAQNAEIGLRLISPLYFGEEGSRVDDATLTMMSGKQHEAVMLLPPDSISYIKDLRNALKIDNYIRTVADPQKGKSTTIRATKIQESAQAKESALDALKEAIGMSEIYINGSKVTDVTTHDAASRINEAMSLLVDGYYFKLSYMGAPKDDVDIRSLFKKDNQSSLDLGETEDPNAHALTDVREFISLSTGGHNRIALKNVIDQFLKAPYGFTESDVRYLVASLFKSGDLSVTVDKEPITLFNREAEDLGNYFTNRKYLEKILMTVREEVPKNKRDNCKELMKQLFNVTERTEDADKLMSAFMEHAKEMLDDCREMLLEHDKVTPEFPGATPLQTAIKLLTEITAVKETGAFFNKLMSDKTAWFDLADDIQPVKTFYNNETQKSIFRDSGLRALKFYESSKEHIVDEELEKIIGEIISIVRNKKPYKLIKDLPELYKKFIARYNITLESKLEPVKQIIEQDKQTVLDKLSGTPFEEELKSKVITDFMELEKRASETADISEMLGFKDKADSRCTYWLNEISRRMANTTTTTLPEDGQGATGDVPPVGTPPTKSEKTVLARNITADWHIETKEELDKCLDTLRKQIETQMDEDHIVVVKF